MICERENLIGSDDFRFQISDFRSQNLESEISNMNLWSSNQYNFVSSIPV
jgi:hypothetical protein